MFILPKQKRRLKKLFLFLLSAQVFFSAVHAQMDSCNLRISLLTCAPGEELYSTFGHTAIRVVDDSRIPQGDYIFNYGSFEFGPDFYVKFIRGKLLYFLSVETWESFRYQYFMENRSVVEQEVVLSCPEKTKLFAALMDNAREENRYYRYDFLFDNCTTRAGEMIASQTDTPVVFRNILPEDIPSFRDLIHSYLDAGQQYWSKLGIDILLGAKLDRKVSNQEAMFLPDYLLKGFDSARVNGRPLVSPARTVLDRPEVHKDNPVFTPFVVFALFGILVFALSRIRKPWARKTVLITDFLLFFFLGLAGILLLFMWFGTDHTVTQNNYNLLWALPFHVYAAFFVHSRRKGKYTYFRAVAVLSLVLMLAWFFLPQEMNPALLPLVALITYRSWVHSKTEGHGGTQNKSKRN